MCWVGSICDLALRHCRFAESTAEIGFRLLAATCWLNVFLRLGHCKFVWVLDLMYGLTCWMYLCRKFALGGFTMMNDCRISCHVSGCQCIDTFCYIGLECSSLLLVWICAGWILHSLLYFLCLASVGSCFGVEEAFNIWLQLACWMSSYMLDTVQLVG